MQREAEKEGEKIKNENVRLRNNAIFGKSIENPMKKFDITIVTTKKQYLKWSFRPPFKRKKRFRNGAIAIRKEKCRINLNKLICSGTCILDLSKVLKYDVHYNYIKNKYGNKAEMLLTDTGSLMYRIETENVYE